MSGTVSREDLRAAAVAYVQSRLGVSEFFQKYFDFLRPMPEVLDLPPEPQPPITPETIAEYEQAKATEDAAREEWERVLGRFLEGS